MSLWPAAASASPHPTLPARTAAQLLVDVQTSAQRTLSGTVVETARLGLPSLPGAGSTAALSWQSLVTGSHTARVWVDGPDRQRVALLGQLSESDVIRSGRDLWTYSSDTTAVTHSALTPAAGGHRSDADGQDAADARQYTPAEAAARALKAIDPTTLVGVDRTARVAGRPVYTLVLQPRDTRSTVRRVLIAVDSRTGVPLRVQVFGAGSSPAFETGFTDVTFRTPAASVFQFRPPAGSTVTDGLPASLTAGGRGGAGGEESRTTTIGTGWTSVLEIAGPAGGDSAAAALSGRAGGRAAGSSTTGLLDRLTTALPNGDRLLRTSLVDALLTRDGRVYVGAVTPDLLQRVAGQHG